MEGSGASVGEAFLDPSSSSNLSSLIRPNQEIIGQASSQV
jgi:hypothetical protein